MSGEGASDHESRITRIEARQERALTDIGELRDDVDALKRFQAWVFGIGTGVGTIGAFLVQSVKDRFGF